MKKIPQLVKILDTWFSLFIRLRDSDKSGLVKCCTCGHTHPYKQVDAGHFITRGDYPTRWDEINVHGQCKRCNLRGGEQHKYAQFLDKTYGEGTAEMLQIKRHNTMHLDRVILEILINEYKVKVSNLKKEKGL